MNVNPRLILTSAMIAFLVLLGAMGCDTEESLPVGEQAGAAMMSADGAPMGTVTLTQGPHGVLLSADLSGLAPGWHAFHLHGVGSCSPDFTAAGGHFAPDETGHGFMAEGGAHPGDMPNIHAAADGTARAEVFHRAITLAPDRDNSILDEDGSAIIIHEKPDSYGDEPGAGDRVSCGVITAN